MASSIIIAGGSALRPPFLTGGAAKLVTAQMRGGLGQEENGRKLWYLIEWISMVLGMSDMFEHYCTGLYAAAL